MLRCPRMQASAKFFIFSIQIIDQSIQISLKFFSLKHKISFFSLFTNMNRVKKYEQGKNMNRVKICNNKIKECSDVF